MSLRKSGEQIIKQGLTAEAPVSHSGPGARGDSNTIDSVTLQTKGYSIERTILIIVKITCALGDFNRTISLSGSDNFST